MLGNEDQRRHVAQETLLIVEDNELNLKLYQDLLQAQGYRVLQAKDGGAALEIARRAKPDLILMDIQLPGPSGLEVVKWLKNDDSLKTIPVVAITAYAQKGDEERIREGGFDAYIAIPIHIVQFIETIERSLRTGAA